MTDLKEIERGKLHHKNFQHFDEPQEQFSKKQFCR